jgi:hypothetical protein
MKKTFLLVFSVLFVVMGFLAIIGWPYGVDKFLEPEWHAWIKIILGLIGIIVAFGKDK